MPLAIELAAARVRALSPAEILEGLHDRFRLLTGGARTAVRRQQTLRASVDWSHALLSDSERVVFRRLAVFLGGFDLEAAQPVAGGGDMQRFQVLDLLALLVDKSLVVADNSEGPTRYRLLETVRQYALEKLAESGEADAVRTRHRDHYTSMAALLDAPGRADYEPRLEQAENEMDNLRAAFGWSRENAENESALALASSLQPLWLTRSHILEGRAWFDTILNDEHASRADGATAVRARALADTAVLGIWVDTAVSMDLAQQALAIARRLDDPRLLARALAACGFTAANSYNAEVAATYFAEAIDLARALDDRWRLCQILTFQTSMAIFVGDPIAARPAGEEGRDLADAIGDRFSSLECRASLAYVQHIQGDLAGAVAQFRAVTAEADAAHDFYLKPYTLIGLSHALACQGEATAARAVADATVEAAGELGYFLGMGYAALANVAMAAGDIEAAENASQVAWQHFSATHPQFAVAERAFVGTEIALAGGDIVSARAWADDAVSVAMGWHRVVALTTHARVAIAEGKREEAERDAHDALALAANIGAYLNVPDVLECLAGLAGDAGGHHEAGRVFGAAETIRQRMGLVRFPIHQPGYEASVAALRDAMGDEDFDAAWAEGTGLSIDEAIAYAQRGHGERKRPTSGWASLTPTERNVVRLVSEGLANNDIATRLFVSPRTVQTRLTHVYTKLGLTSRVQLAQEATRHA